MFEIINNTFTVYPTHLFKFRLKTELLKIFY